MNWKSMVVTRRRSFLALALATTSMGMPTLAFAQDADEPEAEEQTGLSVITVTAQRREENLQDAAVAVTAVGGDELARSAITDATQITALVPALQINSAFGPTSTFYVRGVGNFVANVQSDPAVIVNLDGVPIARPTGVNGMFFDLDRVEVLKGPQGTLYGRNATGGAVNLITRSPSLAGVSGYANISYGNYDAVKANAALNLPLADNVAVRVAGMYSDRDGTYTDGRGDENVAAVRLSLLAELGEDVTLTVSGDYAHQGGVGSGSTAQGLNLNDRIGLFDPAASQALYDRPLNPAPYPFSAAGFNGISGTVLQNPGNVPGLVPFQDSDFYGIRAQLDVETSVGTVTFTPSYRRADLNFSALTGPAALVDSTDEQTPSSCV